METMNPENSDELSTGIRFFGAFAAIALILLGIMA